MSSQKSSGTRDERGAVGTLVGLLVGALVMTGLLAWSVDAGQIFWERRQTQNAADAAAFALAQSCAKGKCDANADGLPALVNANTVNNGSRSHVIERQCKRNSTAGSLPVCAPLPSSAAALEALPECTPLPPGVNAALPHVEVRIRADEGGQPGFTNPFARLGGDQTSSVMSCARAAWGTPIAAAAKSPFAISLCEWKKYTGSNNEYVADPPVGDWPGYGASPKPSYPPPADGSNSAKRELVIYLHDQDNAAGCHVNGKDTSGGFGYLDKASADCDPSISTTNGVDYWAEISTGSSPPSECRTLLEQFWTSGPTIDIPVFDCLVRAPSAPSVVPSACDPAGGGGAKTWYHIVGVARFYLSGYKVTGSAEKPSRIPGGIGVPCSGADRCVSGWFLQGVLSNPIGGVVPPTPSNPGFGLSAVIAAG